MRKFVLVILYCGLLTACGKKPSALDTPSPPPGVMREQEIMHKQYMDQMAEKERLEQLQRIN